jgi:FkbM family methyltransferase
MGPSNQPTKLDAIARVPARLSKCAPKSFFHVLYDRLLNSRLGRQLPGRGAIASVVLRGNAAPFFARLGTTDWMVLDEIYLLGGYNCVAHGVRTPIRRVLDLGANVGFSVRKWHELFPDAEIVGVEPDGENLRLCEMNCRCLGKKFRATQALAGAVAGFAALDYNHGAWGIRKAVSEACKPGAAKVPVMSVPQILAETGWGDGVGFLKCDIEGSEWEVFANCRSWIHQVAHLLIELHGADPLQRFRRLLSENGADFEELACSQGDNYAVLFLARRLRLSATEPLSP